MPSPIGSRHSTLLHSHLSLTLAHHPQVSLDSCHTSPAICIPSPSLQPSPLCTLLKPLLWPFVQLLHLAAVTRRPTLLTPWLSITYAAPLSLHPRYSSYLPAFWPACKLISIFLPSSPMTSVIGSQQEVVNCLTIHVFA